MLKFSLSFYLFIKKWLKGKNAHKTYWKDWFLSLLWTDRSEYEEYQISQQFRSQLSTAIFKIPAQ